MPCLHEDVAVFAEINAAFAQGMCPDELKFALRIAVFARVGGIAVHKESTRKQRVRK